MDFKKCRKEVGKKNIQRECCSSQCLWSKPQNKREPCSTYTHLHSQKQRIPDKHSSWAKACPTKTWLCRQLSRCFCFEEVGWKSESFASRTSTTGITEVKINSSNNIEISNEIMMVLFEIENLSLYQNDSSV